MSSGSAIKTGFRLSGLLTYIYIYIYIHIYIYTYMCVCVCVLVLYKASYSLSVTPDYCSKLAEHGKEAQQPNLWACYGYNSMCRLKKTMRVDRSVNFSFRIRQQIKEMPYIIAKIWIAYSSCRTKNKIPVLLSSSHAKGVKLILVHFVWC